MVWQSYGMSKIVSHCAAVIGYDKRIMFFLLRYVRYFYYIIHPCVLPVWEK